MEYHVYWLVKFLKTFGDGKYGLLSSQNVDGNMIFINYWKVLVLNFSQMRNTVFFWAQKLMKRWYLLINEKFLFWTLHKWGIRSSFEPKSWWKEDIYFVFLSFPLYSRTWEIYFFVQCSLYDAKKLKEYLNRIWLIDYQNSVRFFRLKTIELYHIFFVYLVTSALREMCKYEVTSGTYFPVFGLNTEIYINIFNPNTGKCGPEITPYFDTFHAV